METCIKYVNVFDRSAHLEPAHPTRDCTSVGCPVTASAAEVHEPSCSGLSFTASYRTIASAFSLSRPLVNPQGMKPVQNRSRVGLSSCNASTYQWCGAVVVVCVVVGLTMQALLSNHHLNTIQHRLEQQNMVSMLGQTTDLQINFSQASYPRHIQQLSLQETIRGQKISYAYHMGNPQGTATYGNLALVKFGSKYIAAARRSHWAMAYRQAALQADQILHSCLNSL